MSIFEKKNIEKEWQTEAGLRAASWVSVRVCRY